MRVLLDINVVLDVVLARQPWAAEASLLLAAAETGRIEGYVAGHTITTLYYIVAKAKDRPTAAVAVTDLLRIVDVVPVESADFQQALVLGLADFEDAVQAAAALKVGAAYLATRDAKDFRGAPIPARSPAEILAVLPPENI